MITISKQIYVDADTPVMTLQGVSEGNYDVVVVLQPIKKMKRRRAGFSKAHFTISDDFNAPLEDFKEYML